jgi:copper chaperone CopZ
VKGKNTMKQKFTITGLDCPNCAAKLAKIMENLEGVTSAKINFLTEKLTVESDLSESELIPLLSKAATDFERGVKIEK